MEMSNSMLKLHSLNYTQAKTYITTLLFALGNLLLPQLCHYFVPNGGMMLLPIYFFTLVGAYKYGWKVGLLVALSSPILSFVISGMPTITMLPVLLLKSTLLAICASLAAKHFNKISIPILIGVVLSYQILGTLGEAMLRGSFDLAIASFRIGIPGMILQVFGAYLFIKYLLKE